MTGIVPKGIKAGFRLTNNPVSIDYGVQISGGDYRSVDGAISLSLATPMRKRLDLPWSAGDNGGGMDGGALVAGQDYHAHIIGGPGMPDDVLFSTSPLNPGLPAGYTDFLPVGGVVLSSAAKILPFLQTGGRFDFMMPQTAANNLGVGASQALPLPVPKGVKVLADFIVVPQNSSGAYFRVKDADLGALSDADAVTNFAGGPATTQVLCMTSSAGRVNVGSTNGGTFSAFVRGWFDERGVNA